MHAIIETPKQLKIRAKKNTRTQIKAEFCEAELMTMANIISFWKGKGSKDNIVNERGTFILNVSRMIKNKLINNDIKKVHVSGWYIGIKSFFLVSRCMIVKAYQLKSFVRGESKFEIRTLSVNPTLRFDPPPPPHGLSVNPAL